MKKNIIKKVVLFIAIFVCSLFLVACDNGGNDNKETGNISEIKAWVLEQVKPYVTDDVVLPTTHPTLGGEISWFSTDSDILFDDGTIAERGTKAQEVDLGFVINYNGAIDGDTITLHIAPITLEEAVAKFEKSLPKRQNEKQEILYFVQRDLDFPTNYYGVITLDIESSDQNLLTNEGKYIKPIEESSVTVKVAFSDSYRTINKEYNMAVYGKTILETLDEGIEWLDANFVDMLLTSETGLPTVTGNGCNITWTSTNPDVVTKDGKVIESPFERYVSLKAKVEFSGQTENHEYFCKVKACDSTNMTMDQKLEAYLKAIGISSFTQMKFGAYGNINGSYGFIYFHDNSELEVIEAIIGTDKGNKPNQDRTLTKMITVHDTANTNASADAAMHSRYINNGSGGAQTSWHYSVGDDAIYHQVEDDEIAWHAGDGSRTFHLNDTGVKATCGYPLLTFSDDNYYVLGGVKTTVKLPSDTKNKRIGPYGLYMEVGQNGNWWINDSYYNSSYGWICNCGGNRNTVSMETCVNSGSDFIKTFVNACKVTTKLVRKYNLTCDGIMQHNNFSGKDCPNAIRQAGQWAQFRDLCSVMKYGYDTFSDYTFEWTSNDTSKLTAKGFITLSCKAGDTISYSVKVSKNSIPVLTKDFSTKLA